jgi:uncharacterized lipoprotein
MYNSKKIRKEIVVKNLVSIVVAAFILGGCSYKNEAISLSSYKSQYKGTVSADHKTVVLSSVSDDRADKLNIGFVQADGKPTIKLFSYEDFAAKYKEGLTNALKAAQVNLDDNGTTAAMKVDVKIKNIDIVYNDTKKFDENLHGKIVVEVTITQGDKITVQTFTQDQGIWIQPSYKSKDYEPLLYTLFASSINDIVSKIATF